MGTTQTPCTQDPDRWYSQDPAKVASCLEVCQTCPVRQQCLQLALDSGETGAHTGIWGGTLPEQRAQLVDEQSPPTIADESHYRGEQLLVGAA